MTYREYNDRQDDMVNSYNNGEMSLPDLQYELAKLNREYEGQSVEDYEARQRKIVKEYEDGEISYGNSIRKLSELDKEFKELESSRPASTFDNRMERAEEAVARMKETHRKVKQEWAHARLDGDKVKVKKGSHGLPLLDMSVLEARLLANEILSITNKQRRK